MMEPGVTSKEEVLGSADGTVWVRLRSARTSADSISLVIEPGATDSAIRAYSAARARGVAVMG